jgi:N-acetylglucosamine-6-sulfatase
VAGMFESEHVPGGVMTAGRSLVVLAVVGALAAGLLNAPETIAGPDSRRGDTTTSGSTRISTLSPAEAVTGITEDRPNIVLITTDDMNRSDLRWMPITRRLLGRGGVTVSDFIRNHPLCCPARAQILTGQYGHNNGVTDNPISRWGGYSRLKRPAQHVGRWLKDAGYNTALIGKHLNGWERVRTRQPGWTVFNPLMRNVYGAYG